MAKKAVVLLSGGIDSTTTLHIAHAEGYGIYALSFRYGQRNQFEIDAACHILRSLAIKDHLILTIDLSVIGCSALTTEIPVPKERSELEISQNIPFTYVPARNTIFLSFALAWAESLSSSDIFIGVNVIDYSGYPDCRPQFIEAFEKMANLATRTGVEGRPIHIHTPLIQMTKAQIIQKGIELGVDFSMTQSCYDPSSDGKACGKCDSCFLRKKGFKEAGIPDPTIYI
ncbi:7-cyano-7-deazaguanine synthase QueC [bacterium]|nr:7-cyano-7-deazaguanine synthase QueC [bacterium]